MEGTPPMSSYEDETGVKIISIIIIIIIIIILNRYDFNLCFKTVRLREWSGNNNNNNNNNEYD